MSTLAAILLGILGTLVSIGTHLAMHGRGYRRGLRHGYELGRKYADGWWLGIEREIDEERQKLWKEKER